MSYGIVRNEIRLYLKIGMIWFGDIELLLLDIWKLMQKSYKYGLSFQSHL